MDSFQFIILCETPHNITGHTVALAAECFHLINILDLCLPIPPREHRRDPQQAFKLVISQPNRTHRHEDFNPRSRGWLPQEVSPSLFLSLFRVTITPGLIYTLSPISPNCGEGTRTLGSGVWTQYVRHYTTPRYVFVLTEHLNTQIIIYMLRN